MKILFVSSEVVPFAKTGGLADVAGSLPKALKDLGHEIRIFMPRYKKMDPVKLNLQKVTPDIWEGRLPDSKVIVYFFEHEGYFGSRDELYQVGGVDFADNLERFAAFCQAAPKLCQALNWQPDIVHCNDWQSALIIAYLRVLYQHDQFFQKTASLYSIHNMGYLGVFPKEKLPQTGLSWDQFTPDKLEFWGQLALTKAGFVYADLINTVSETYAREIQTAEFGHGLDGLLRARSQDVFGIVNGLDYNLWNPATDSQIPKCFTPTALAGKLACKKELQKQNGLPLAKDAPVIGMITRLADQKGFDILASALAKIMRLGCQLVILGTGDSKYHELFQSAKTKYPNQIGLSLKFDAILAQLIYAGSDMFLMPSRYEPCGLGQLISFKYGSIPVVRQTGGLADTVSNYNPPSGAGTGFVFSEYSAAALFDALQRAVAVFGDKAAWKKLVQQAMRLDYSWEASAKKYLNLYHKAQARRAG